MNCRSQQKGTDRTLHNNTNVLQLQTLKHASLTGTGTWAPHHGAWLSRVICGRLHVLNLGRFEEGRQSFGLDVAVIGSGADTKLWCLSASGARWRAVLLLF